jgi:polyhydroxybutyrate depolymerase
MRTKIAFVLLIVLYFSTTIFSQTLSNGSFVNQSRTRTYSVYVPASYHPNVPAPLVLNLHGYGSNNAQQLLYGDFRAIADTAGFIIVCPNGTLDPSNTPYWNCFDVPGGPDDVEFLSELIDTISFYYSIDANRIYSTGMSNGGYMSYELASRLSNRITAIASVAGDMLYGHLNNCQTIRPFPVMQIHGTADGTVVYGGDTYSEPIDSLVKFWVDFNHCNSIPAVTNLPDVNTTDGCTATHFVYSGGDSGTTVEFYKINGGGHSWPGASVNINVTNMDFNASAEIWRFFSQYRMSNLSNGIASHEFEINYPVYPNPSGNGNFSIRFENASSRTITITDSLGKIVQSFECNSDAASFTIKNSGIYFVTVSDGKKSSTQKIISK